MMKTTFFDKNLYKEGLRQLRVIGLMGLVILGLSAFLTPLGYIIDGIHTLSYMGSIAKYSSTQVRLLDVHILLPACYLVLAPLLTLYLFHFLNKRDTSDFYHAIPQTRICLFGSFFAAIVTWLAIIVLGSSLLACLMCGIGSDFLALNLASVFSLCFQMMAASLLVAAGVAVAMCLTGTLFTNVVVSCLILFLPRLILLVITECIDSALPFVAGEYAVKLLDYQINVVTGTVFGALISNVDEIFYNYTAGIYTLILAILYAALACVLFHKRKSESAGHAAQGARMQLVFRSTVAMVICLIPVIFIFQALVDGYSMTSGEVFLMFVLYVIAAVAYFLYELISTRKWRNMIKAIPGLGVLALVNLVLILGMYGIYRFQANILPEADEIDYVTLPSETMNNYWFPSGDEEFYDYFDSAAETIHLESPAVREMISQRLRETVLYYTEDEYILDGNQRTMNKAVAIKKGLLTYHRYIQMTEEDLDLLMEELKSHEDVHTTYMELPELDGKNVVIASPGSMSQESMEEVYNTMRAEIQEIGFEEWYGIQESMDLQNDRLDRFAIGLYQGTRHCMAELPIVPELPKTWEKYMERKILHEDWEHRVAAVQALKENEQVTYFSIQRQHDEKEAYWDSYQMETVWDSKTGEETAVYQTISSGSMQVLTKEFQDILVPMMEDALDVIPQVGEPYYRIYIEWITLDEDGDEINMGYEGYFALDESLIPDELMTILEAQE